MARYIDAEQFLDSILEYNANFATTSQPYIDGVRKAICKDMVDLVSEQSTADVVSKADYDMLEAKLNFVKAMLGDIAQYGEGLYQNAVKVYCKDCKHYKLLKCPLGNKTKSYDFCSLGEMKEESEGKYIENGRT